MKRTIAAGGLAALLLLGACGGDDKEEASTDGSEEVSDEGGSGSDLKDDIMDSLGDDDDFAELNDEQRDCIEGGLDGLSDSELSDIKADAEANAEPEDASPAGQAFIAGAVDCMLEGGLSGDLRDQLVESLGDLPEEQRECVIAAIEDLNEEEIQEMMTADAPGPELTEALTDCIMG